MKPLLAETLGHNWKTSKRTPDAWFQDTIALIKKHRGDVLAHGAMTMQDDKGRERTLYAIRWRMDGSDFQVRWPVLPTRSGTPRQAQVQAASLLFHDIKARLITAKIMGVRNALMSYLVLPDGQVAGEAVDADLAAQLPKLPIMLPPGESNETN